MHCTQQQPWDQKEDEDDADPVAEVAVGGVILLDVVLVASVVVAAAAAIVVEKEAGYCAEDGSDSAVARGEDGYQSPRETVADDVSLTGGRLHRKKPLDQDGSWPMAAVHPAREASS